MLDDGDKDGDTEGLSENGVLKLGLSEALTEADGDTDPLAEDEGDTEADGLIEIDELGLTLALGLGETEELTEDEGLTLLDCELDGDTEAEGERLDDGDGVAVPAHIDWISASEKALANIAASSTTPSK
jgi:hypothetical protein